MRDKATRNGDQGRQGDGPGMEQSELSRSLGFLVRSVQVLVFEEFFLAFADSPLTPATHATLVMIREQPGIRPGALASTLRIHDPNMTRMVRDLAEAGLVERERPQGDQRATALRLTSKAEEYLRRVDEKTKELERTFASGMSAQDLETLIQLLKKVNAGLAARARVRDRPSRTRSLVGRRAASRALGKSDD